MRVYDRFADEYIDEMAKDPMAPPERYIELSDEAIAKYVADGLMELPSAEAVHESCEDCPLYDKERHNCPRFNKIIPRTIAEVQGDLISRADAIKAVSRAIWHYPNECYKNLNVYEVAETLVSDAIMSLPSAEPKTGEWISNRDGSWNCSECGLRVLVYAKGNYCPNCGARMRGKEE